MKIREGPGVSGRALAGGGAEGFEGCHWSDPGGDGGGEVFSEEGPEGLILPRLNIASGPVVEKAGAEEMIVRLRDGDRGPEQARLPNVKC
jgi:hypothetical protein